MRETSTLHERIHLMDVIIVTGGTGGHIYPALVLGEQLIQRNVTVGFITRKDPLAEKILKANENRAFRQFVRNHDPTGRCAQDLPDGDP